MKRLCPKVPEVDDLFQTPESAICRNVPEMHLVTPSGKRLRYDFDGLVLDRVAHDEALVERAKKSWCGVPRWRQGKEGLRQRCSPFGR